MLMRNSSGFPNRACGSKTSGRSRRTITGLRPCPIDPGFRSWVRPSSRSPIASSQRFSAAAGFSRNPKSCGLPQIILAHWPFQCANRGKSLCGFAGLFARLDLVDLALASPFRSNCRWCRDNRTDAAVACPFHGSKKRCRNGCRDKNEKRIALKIN